MNDLCQGVQEQMFKFKDCENYDEANILVEEYCRAYRGQEDKLIQNLMGMAATAVREDEDTRLAVLSIVAHLRKVS